MAVMQNPDNTAGRLIAASEVQGTSIYNRAGEKLGSVEDVMIDKIGGKAEYAVLSFGGFLGMGTNEYPIPWEKLTYDPRMGGFVVDIDKRILENAPVYSDDARWGESEWRRVNQHYSSLAGASAMGRQR
jgi:sporulation protein YlmC with PRC-barrel domain